MRQVCVDKRFKRQKTGRVQNDADTASDSK